MSNYIYNNFDNNDDDNLNIMYGIPVPTKKRNTTPLIVVGIVLLFVSAIMFVFGCTLNFLASTSNGSQVTEYKPQINNTISYVSQDEKSNASMLNDSESRVAVIARIIDSVVEIKTANGSGSGVIVGKFGNSDNQEGYYIITNAHVLENANANMYTSATITLNDGTEYKSTLCGFDSKSDIAVLQIRENEKELRCAVWANEKNELLVGEEVIVIGNPLGVLGGTVTNGYLSALDREITVSGVKMNLLQTDAAVNPGNSGGGLFNRNGELIGIVNAKIADEDIEGIGFAIPYDDAMKVYSDLRDYGYVTGRTTIGIQIITSRGNVQVVSAPEGSNLKAGDIILGIKTSDDAEFSAVTARSLSNIIGDLEIGETITLKIARNYKEMTVTVTTFEYKK